MEKWHLPKLRAARRPPGEAPLGRKVEVERGSPRGSRRWGGLPRARSQARTATRRGPATPSHGASPPPRAAPPAHYRPFAQARPQGAALGRSSLRPFEALPWRALRSRAPSSRITGTLGKARFHRFNQRQPVYPGHLHVGNNEVRRTPLRKASAASPLSAYRRRYPALRASLPPGAGRGRVIDNQGGNHSRSDRSQGSIAFPSSTGLGCPRRLPEAAARSAPRRGRAEQIRFAQVPGDKLKAHGQRQTPFDGLCQAAWHAERGTPASGAGACRCPPCTWLGGR